jgi:predicted O-methyltransferase YrrM
MTFAVWRGEVSIHMNDDAISRQPAALAALQRDTTELGFTMASEPKTGALLAALAASKPGGRLLELGTGTGLGTAWLLAGMDAAARLDTVDRDPAVVAVARRHLVGDTRVTFHVMDGAEFLAQAAPGQYDLIYADTWPGKFSHLEQALALLRPGGMYFIDDLLPQPNWPAGHAPKVPALIEAIERRSEFTTVKLAWASGLMLVVRSSAA